MFDNINDDDDCSCSSCECSTSIDENIELNTSNMFHINKFNDKENIEYQIDLIDESYRKISNIKQIKLDSNFLFSVNNYLNQLKLNIYQDLIQRETLLRNGKNHTKNLIFLIRSICKISYEQALEISYNSNPLKHAILYISTAIDYIIQNNFPKKKSLFNYTLMEFISMWLHENLRIIQEDFSIIADNEKEEKFFLLCTCIFNKLESICAVNWERLQMIQNYRLTDFDQLLHSTDILFGKNSKLTRNNSSQIQTTLLYSHRNDNELDNLDKINKIFRKSITKILQNQQLISHHQQRIISSSILEKRESSSKFVSLEHQQLLERISQQNQSPSHSNNSSSHSQTLIKNNGTLSSSMPKTSSPIISIKSKAEKSLSEDSQTIFNTDQLESCLKENTINSNLIIEKIRDNHSQSSLNTKDPSFPAELTRVSCKELEDAQILRQIEDDSQNMSCLSFQTNTFEKENIDQNRILIEMVHDPSKYSPLSSQQQWYWRRSNENSLLKDCLITSNALFYPQKSFDKNSYSITIEHNEEFQ